MLLLTMSPHAHMLNLKLETREKGLGHEQRDHLKSSSL